MKSMMRQADTIGRATLSNLKKHFSLRRWVCLGFVLLTTVAAPTLHSAETPHRDISFELQVYPTGVIPGVRFELALDDRQAVHLRLGIQEIDHRDEGVQDDEQGEGAGFTLGYKRYLRPGLTGLAFSFRTDVWFNSLDWRNNIGTPEETSGRTNVTVLQPTVELSWHRSLGSKYFVTPSAAAGFEINVDTDGEDVGEGFIFLVGVLAGVRF